MRLDVQELRSSSGKSYVKKDLESWPIIVVKHIFANFDRLQQHGLGPELIRNQIVEKMRGYKNLYEVKERYNGMCYRVLFPVIGSVCWLVLAVSKKGNKLPLHEVRLADRRARNINGY